MRYFDHLLIFTKSYALTHLGLNLLFCTLSVALLAGCSEDPPDVPVSNCNVELKLVASDFTSLQLELTTKNLGPSHVVRLSRDDEFWLDIPRPPGDTAFLDKGLIPSTDYRYRAEVLLGSEVVCSTEDLVFRTRDTSTTDFEIRVFNCGIASGMFKASLFISDDDAWAVGLFTAWDASTSSWIEYNAAHWNGQEVTYHKIPFYVYIFGKEFLLDDLEIFEVLRFNNEIWFISNGGGATILRNGRFDLHRPGSKEKGPGPAYSHWVADDYFYTGCANGIIRKWDGTEFTTLDIQLEEEVHSMYGHNDSIYILSSDRTPRIPVDLYLISNDNMILRADMKPEPGAEGLWISENGTIFTGGRSLSYWSNGHWVSMTLPFISFINAIDGASIDRFFAVDRRSHVFHYNGWRWHMLPGMHEYNIWFTSLDVSGNGFCAAGTTMGSVATFVVGRHR